MSAPKDEMVNITLKRKGVDTVTVKCSKQVATMLKSQTTDPHIKQLICDNLMKAREWQPTSSQPPDIRQQLNSQPLDIHPTDSKQLDSQPLDMHPTDSQQLDSQSLDMHPTDSQQQDSQDNDKGYSDPCNSRNSSAVSSPGDSECSDGILHWSNEATGILISEIGDRIELVNHGKLKMKTMCKEVANCIKNQIGMIVDCDQVSNKWKSLKRAYKDIQDHNKKSGNDARSHPFKAQLDEILFYKPNINPSAVMSSSSQATNIDTSNGDREQSNKRKMSDAQVDENADSGSAKKRHTQVSQVVDFLHEYTEKQDRRYEQDSKRMERMHHERINIFKDLIEVLKDNK